MAHLISDFIAFDDLVAGLRAFFLGEGVPAEVAEVLARNCALCERDGSHSHGIFRVPGYRASLRSGAINPGADPILERVAPSILRVAVHGGYAQPALVRALPTIRMMLAETGTAVVALRNSHHFSALWPDLEPFAEEGLVGLTMVAGGPTVTVRGATRNVFGTNPIAFGFPLAGARPIVMDLATSTTSNGDLRIARDEGRKVPIGTGLGIGGRDTDDPDEILTHGGALPFGGHKGAALSLMVEALASGLTGGLFSHETDFDAHPSNQTPQTGQFLFVVDPARAGNNAFAARMTEFVAFLRAHGVDRLPSDRRYRYRDAAAERGIPVTDGIRALFA
jgi:delta1-piperideine-2-carboxylate reductase